MSQDYAGPEPQPMQHGEESTKPAGGDELIYGADGVVDFSPTKPRPTFRWMDQTFYGKIEIPTALALKYGTRAAALEAKGDDATDEEQLEATIHMIRMMLQKDSADRFVAAMNDDEEGIGTETFSKILPWLMEQYGMRPTEPSSDSAPGSQTTPDDGANSTENSPEQESTSSTSPSTEPST